MYQLVFEKHVQKQLEKIPEPDYSRIKKALLALTRDPGPPGCKKLRGRAGYRIRQGNSRIIYAVNDHILTVFVIAAGHRKDIYQ
jgi:mRNA interferase RelE/StbE